MDTQTTIDVFQGMIVERLKEVEALTKAKESAEGLLRTQLHDLEVAKAELITVKGELQNALSQPVEEILVQE